MLSSPFYFFLSLCKISLERDWKNQRLRLDVHAAVTRLPAHTHTRYTSEQTKKRKINITSLIARYVYPKSRLFVFTRANQITSCSIAFQSCETIYQFWQGNPDKKWNKPKPEMCRRRNLGNQLKLYWIVPLSIERLKAVSGTVRVTFFLCLPLCCESG